MPSPPNKKADGVESLATQTPSAPDPIHKDHAAILSENGDHPARINRLSYLRAQSLLIAKALNSSSKSHWIPANIKKIYSCSNYLLFRNFYLKNEIKLAGVMACRQRLLCPFCAHLMGAKYLKKMMPKIQGIQENNKTLIPVMITLTIKNGSNLEERLNHLVKSLNTLKVRRRKNRQRKTVYLDEFSKIHSAFYSFEVTNSGKGWHPHVHIFAFIDSYIDQRKLSNQWRVVTGDSFVVGITQIAKDQDSIFKGACEVIKYALKFADFRLPDDSYDSDKIIDFYMTTRGRRLTGTLGDFRGIEFDDNDLVDDLYQDQPYIDMFYRYTQSGYTHAFPRTPPD